MSRSPSLWDVWTWPLAAGARAGELAFRTLGEFWASSEQGEAKGPEPLYTTPNQTVLELTTLRVRDFSHGHHGPPTVVVAPLALHGAAMADFAHQHSLVERLLVEGLDRVLLIEWSSASPAMRYLSIDSYLADLGIAIEDLGGRANLVGLCQGGWLSLMFAARYPHKVAKLVLAGSPVDLGAAGATMVDAVRATSPEVFEAVVESGQGLVLCRRALDLWPDPDLGDACIASILQSDCSLSGDLVAKFRQWHQWTLNLPGVYYLQVVEDLYRHNRLAQGEFRALGRKLDLSVVQAPVYLLAGQEDEIVPPEQVLGVARLVGTPPTSLRAAVAPCGHLSLFMGARTLATEWRHIGEWLQ